MLVTCKILHIIISIVKLFISFKKDAVQVLYKSHYCPQFICKLSDIIFAISMNDTWNIHLLYMNPVVINYLKIATLWRSNMVSKKKQGSKPSRPNSTKGQQHAIPQTPTTQRRSVDNCSSHRCVKCRSPGDLHRGETNTKMLFLHASLLFFLIVQEKSPTGSIWILLLSII